MPDTRIRLTVSGADEVLRRLRALGADFPAAAGRALKRFVETEVATPAKQDYVPVVTGALRSSIVTDEPAIAGNRITVTVGAGGAAVPYARLVHENPRAGRTGGLSPSGKRYKRWSRVGQWKYLEQPAIEAAYTKLDAFAREARVELDEVIRGLR